MITVTNNAACCGCEACANVCPKQCITMIRDAEGFVYPHIEESQCVHCNLCDKACPVINPPSLSDVPPKALAAYNSNEQELLASSSGGVFYLLAKRFLAHGAIVYGAAYAKDFTVTHIAVQHADELSRLQGTKYVQSQIGHTYRDVKGQLQDGKTVLFSGTPCQIAGLYSYLGKPYDNLFTVDLICSGVPSPLAWEQYLHFRSAKAGSPLKTVNLRCKDVGWQEYILDIAFENGKHYQCTRFEDPYMRAFRAHCSLRPSCYHCAFKTQQRVADITVADFWGVETIAPAMNNRKGTSLVFIHSQKGADMIRHITDDCCCSEVDSITASAHNPMMTTSAKEPAYRAAFFKMLAERSVVKAANRYCPLPLSARLRFFKNRAVNAMRHLLKRT